MEIGNTFSKNEEDEEIEEFEEPLAQPGRIFLAEIHGSAQRFLKINKLSKYIRFCKCCLLPSETPGVVVPYTCLDNLEDFGIGLHLYFVYIKFCIMVAFIGLFLAAIPTLVFSQKYSNHLKDYCEWYNNELFHSENLTNIVFNFEMLEICQRYYEMYNSTSDDFIRFDWLERFEGDNIIDYYDFFEIIANKTEPMEDIIINFSFLYFLTSIVLLIINFFFIHYVNLINDKEDFESTTPRDFAVLIQGVQKPDQKTTKLEHLQNIINEISRDYFELKLHHIIPCYNLVKLYKLTKDVFEDKIKVYHAYNFKRQKDLHQIYSRQYHHEKECNYDRSNCGLSFQGLKENTNSSLNYEEIDPYLKDQTIHKINQKNITWTQLNQYSNDVYIHDDNLNYYSKVFWNIKATPLNEIEKRMAINRKKIQEIEKDLEMNPDKHSSGTYFVVFKYIIMKDRFYDFFPTHFITKILVRIKYFFQNIMFSRCVSERTKRTNYIRKEFEVNHATEAYEVIWQNMGFSYCQKFMHSLLSISISIILIGISFGIVLLLNYIQYSLIENENLEESYEYLLSLIISLIISFINSLGRKILKFITKRFEASETKTDYYISLSFKITVFTFLNTSMVPLFSNAIFSKWIEKNILLINIFFIFLVNFALTPIFFYLNFTLIFKLTRRAKAVREIEGLPLKDSTYTQDELNRLFENPSMSLCYKYSFYSNMILTSFFYMSIFPLSIVFSIFGLGIAYFLEIVHLQFYKRPEVLNSKLCKFFVNHFNIAIFIFALGNMIFLRDCEQHFSPDWNLINFIIFLVIIFIPYYSFKIDLLAVKEGEVTKGSYDEYELMFPTDYEKQNPLTKKTAMIKYFKKLKEINEIDDMQYKFLINNINKESSMVNYYKTSRNVGNILNYYEFQNQFVRFRKKAKYIKESKLKKRKKNLHNYDIFINQKAKERRETIISMNLNVPNQYNKKPSHKINDVDEYSNLGYNKNYKIKGLMENNPKMRRRISNHIRQVLFQNIKDQGLYSETEDNNDEDEESFNQMISDESSKITTSNLNVNRSNKKTEDK